MRALRAVAALGVLGLALAACSGDSGKSSLPTPSKAFCRAAYDFDTNAAKLVGKIQQQTELVQKMADHAPKDIAKDAQVYLDAMKRRAAGDTSKKTVDNPEVQRAVVNVNRRAADGCELYKQNQDGTSGI